MHRAHPERSSLPAMSDFSRFLRLLRLTCAGHSESSSLPAREWLADWASLGAEHTHGSVVKGASLGVAGGLSKEGNGGTRHNNNIIIINI